MGIRDRIRFLCHRVIIAEHREDFRMTEVMKKTVRKVKRMLDTEGMEKMIRKRITFTGRVQGVGFRWRAEKAADMFRCTGWCRNEWDGSVTMEIQGREEDSDQVILHVEAGRYVRIENMRVKDLPVIEGERYFITE